MNKWPKDLSGMTFGRLKVLRQSENFYITKEGWHCQKYICQCNCDNKTIIEVLRSNLINGNTTSCGCYHQEQNTKKFKGMLYNRYDLTGEYGIGYTSNKNSPFYFDLEDYEKIKKYTWLENNVGYITCVDVFNERRELKLHQLVFGKKCDHINRKRFDNRKSNLREATDRENARNQNRAKNNTSGFIGVNWHKHNKSWTVRINLNIKGKGNERKILGSFKNKEETIRIRLQGEYDVYGIDFAPQRELFEKYNIPDKKLHEQIKNKIIPSS